MNNQPMADVTYISQSAEIRPEVQACVKRKQVSAKARQIMATAIKVMRSSQETGLQPAVSSERVSPGYAPLIADGVTQLSVGSNNYEQPTGQAAEALHQQRQLLSNTREALDAIHRPLVPEVEEEWGLAA